MLRKKSSYRKELNSYMYVSQFCARLERINALHIWMQKLDDITFSSDSRLTRLEWNQDED